MSEQSQAERSGIRSPIPHRYRLWVRLFVAFALVAVAAVGTIAILANRATSRQFEVYVSEGRSMRAEEMAPEFADYYAQMGSWTGVGEWMADLVQARPGGRGQGRGPGLGTGSPSDRLLLADAEGWVVADSQGALVGQRLSDSELAAGASIEVGGQSVGTLLLTSEATAHEPLEEKFLIQVNQALLWAGLIAAAVALVLGLVLARQLTAPLRALTVAAHRLAGGEVLRVEVHGRDEIGELGQAFNQMAQSLARQERLRRNLMADIAHELRTPLTVIRGDLEALLDGLFEPTPEALASLQEETLLLSRLVDDLRALAQAEAGQLQLELEWVNLADLLRGVVASFGFQAESQGQVLSLDLAPDLPLVYADRHRVRQVVANLISNALFHAAESGRVVAAAVPLEAEVRVSVVDNGQGIPPDDLVHVFDRFWRGGRTRAEGSGLGLAIVRELVRAQGGRIWVESKLGGGTSFHFTLPCAVSSP